LLGPAFVNAIRDLFPKVDFVVTGGVEANKDNLESWFKSGVCALGMGSKLVRQNLMASKDYSTIETESRKTLELIQSITK
jgi:2-dehydro-3-deoxyphosphogluconate aldolase/(4S)-4-hydroxy-2-oxoglutarate aldolase